MNAPRFEILPNNTMLKLSGRIVEIDILKMEEKLIRIGVGAEIAFGWYERVFPPPLIVETMPYKLNEAHRDGSVANFGVLWQRDKEVK